MSYEGPRKARSVRVRLSQETGVISSFAKPRFCGPMVSTHPALFLLSPWPIASPTHFHPAHTHTHTHYFGAISLGNWISGKKGSLGGLTWWYMTLESCNWHGSSPVTQGQVAANSPWLEQAMAFLRALGWCPVGYVAFSQRGTLGHHHAYSPSCPLCHSPLSKTECQSPRQH